MQQADIITVLGGVITADEAAKRLEVTRKTVTRRIKRNEIPGVKIGIHYFTHDVFVPVSSPSLDGTPKTDDVAA